MSKSAYDSFDTSFSYPGFMQTGSSLLVKTPVLGGNTGDFISSSRQFSLAPCFEPLPPKYVQYQLSQSSVMTLQPSQQQFREGEDSDFSYVVQSGNATVFVEQPNETMQPLYHTLVNTTKEAVVSIEKQREYLARKKKQQRDIPEILHSAQTQDDLDDASTVVSSRLDASFHAGMFPRHSVTNSPGQGVLSQSRDFKSFKEERETWTKEKPLELLSGSYRMPSPAYRANGMFMQDQPSPSTSLLDTTSTYSSYDNNSNTSNIKHSINPNISTSKALGEKPQFFITLPTIHDSHVASTSNNNHNTSNYNHNNNNNNNHRKINTSTTTTITLPIVQTKPIALTPRAQKPIDRTGSSLIVNNVNTTNNHHIRTKDLLQTLKIGQKVYHVYKSLQKPEVPIIHVPIQQNIAPVETNPFQLQVLERVSMSLRYKVEPNKVASKQAYKPLQQIQDAELLGISIPVLYTQFTQFPVASLLSIMNLLSPSDSHGNSKLLTDPAWWQMQKHLDKNKTAQSAVRKSGMFRYFEALGIDPFPVRSKSKQVPDTGIVKWKGEEMIIATEGLGERYINFSNFSENNSNTNATNKSHVTNNHNANSAFHFHLDTESQQHQKRVGQDIDQKTFLLNEISRQQRKQGGQPLDVAPHDSVKAAQKRLEQYAKKQQTQSRLKYNAAEIIGKLVLLNKKEPRRRVSLQKRMLQKVLYKTGRLIKKKKVSLIAGRVSNVESSFSKDNQTPLLRKGDMVTRPFRGNESVVDEQVLQHSYQNRDFKEKKQRLSHSSSLHQSRVSSSDTTGYAHTPKRSSISSPSSSPIALHRSNSNYSSFSTGHTVSVRIPSISRSETPNRKPPSPSPMRVGNVSPPSVPFVVQEQVPAFGCVRFTVKAGKGKKLRLRLVPVQTPNTSQTSSMRMPRRSFNTGNTPRGSLTPRQSGSFFRTKNHINATVQSIPNVTMEPEYERLFQTYCALPMNTLIDLTVSTACDNPAPETLQEVEHMKSFMDPITIYSECTDKEWHICVENLHSIPVSIAVCIDAPRRHALTSEILPTACVIGDITHEILPIQRCGPGRLFIPKGHKYTVANAESTETLTVLKIPRQTLHAICQIRKTKQQFHGMFQTQERALMTQQQKIMRKRVVQAFPYGAVNRQDTLEELLTLSKRVVRAYNFAQDKEVGKLSRNLTGKTARAFKILKDSLQPSDVHILARVPKPRKAHLTKEDLFLYGKAKKVHQHVVHRSIGIENSDNTVKLEDVEKSLPEEVKERYKVHVLQRVGNGSRQTVQSTLPLTVVNNLFKEHQERTLVVLTPLSVDDIYTKVDKTTSVDNGEHQTGIGYIPKDKPIVYKSARVRWEKVGTRRAGLEETSAGELRGMQQSQSEVKDEWLSISTGPTYLAPTPQILGLKPSDTVDLAHQKAQRDKTIIAPQGPRMLPVASLNDSLIVGARIQMKRRMSTIMTPTLTMPRDMIQAKAAEDALQVLTNEELYRVPDILTSRTVAPLPEPVSTTSRHTVHVPNFDKYYQRMKLFGSMRSSIPKIEADDENFEIGHFSKKQHDMEALLSVIKKKAAFLAQDSENQLMQTNVHLRRKSVLHTEIANALTKKEISYVQSARRKLSVVHLSPREDATGSPNVLSALITSRMHRTVSNASHLKAVDVAIPVDIQDLSLQTGSPPLISTMFDLSKIAPLVIPTPHFSPWGVDHKDRHSSNSLYTNESDNNTILTNNTNDPVLNSSYSESRVTTENIASSIVTYPMPPVNRPKLKSIRHRLKTNKPSQSQTAQLYTSQKKHAETKRQNVQTRKLVPLSPSRLLEER